jgi:acyl-coenzyme A thioesterase PaaI-like protein
MTVTHLDSRSRALKLTRVDTRAFTPSDAQDLLRTRCAPWVRDLNLVVEACSVAGAWLRLPYSPRSTHADGTICVQALMACADAAMMVAIAALFGEFRNVVPVAQSISFMRAIAIEDATIVATVPTLGTDPIVGEVTIKADGNDAVAAQGTATWASVAGKSRARFVARGDRIVTESSNVNLHRIRI